MQPSYLNFQLRNRGGIIFSGQIASLTAENDYGKFDILPNHIHFISIINNNLLIRLVDKSIKAIKVNNAIMRVLDNNVTVLLGFKNT